MDRELQRILYIEDEADIRRVVKMALESIGRMTVIACASGEEAIAIAPDIAIDLILLDVMMPRLDGPTTLRRLREQAGMAAIPVVFMTAKVQPDEIEFFKSLGALDVIGKPFDALTLADTLRAIWQRSVPSSAAAVSLLQVEAGKLDVTPPTEAEAKFAARMAQLRQQFESELPTRLQELQRAWMQLEAQWNSDVLRALHVNAHNLAGSGATFGYATITEAARAFDAHLKPLLAQSITPNTECWSEARVSFLALETELRRALAMRA